RYLALVKKHRQNPFSKKLLQDIQPYLDNWLLFHEWIKPASFPSETSGTEIHPDATTDQQALREEAEIGSLEDEELFFEEELFEEIPEEEEPFSLPFASPEPHMEEAPEEIREEPVSKTETREPESSASPEVMDSEEIKEVTKPEEPESRGESFKELFGN